MTTPALLPLRLTLVASLVASLAACAPAARPASSSGAAPPPTRGSGIERDADVARNEPGPHAGGGATTAYSFFADAADLGFVFRKRALHPGSAIGYHRNDEDEIYYVLAGRGELTLDGARQEVGPGTAILTRAGSSHALRPLGGDDLVIVITYPRAARR